jgi:hypothetical protein
LLGPLQDRQLLVDEVLLGKVRHAMTLVRVSTAGNGPWGGRERKHTDARLLGGDKTDETPREADRPRFRRFCR